MRSQCQCCGHRIVGRVLEVEGEWLYRCPVCDGYDWRPAPRLVPSAPPTAQTVLPHKIVEP